MREFKFRNLCCLYGHKVILVLLFLFTVTISSYAQRGSAKNYNYLDYQHKPYYFGITLAGNHSSFKVQHSEKFILNDSISINYGQGNMGLTFQLISNLKIGDYFDFRFLAGISIAERSIAYFKPEEENPYDIRRIEFVYIDVPMLLRYKSSPFRDKRMFVVAGMRYTYDVNGGAPNRQDLDLVAISPHDFSAELGVGIQIFLPFFIFSPEIKFSQGIGNILQYNSNLNQSSVIDRLTSRTFTISLHFEG